MSRTALAFMSYVNLNDQYENRKMTQFCERLSTEVRLRTGEPFEIFQDRGSIAWSQQWEARIDDSIDIDPGTFLIPIITPAFFKSDACREELELFLEREEELGRNNLIFPIYYVTCLMLHDEQAQIIEARQYADWRDLRFEEFTSPLVRKALAKMAEQIVQAMEQEPLPTTVKPPPTVVVDARHCGDYSTLTKALNAVNAGTRIIVRPGLYQEGIVIDKQVEIIGDGNRSEIVIQASCKPAILFEAAMGKVANLTLCQVDSEKYSCVDIAAGRLELEDCNIVKKGRAGVAIHNGANPILRRCSIHHGQKVGVHVYDKGQGLIEDNEIFANTLAGVAISADGNPTLRNNRIFRNGGAGVWIFNGGAGIYENNDLRDNAKGAWSIAPGAESRVQRRGNKE